MRVDTLELEELAAKEKKGKPIVGNYIDLLRNVKVSLEVVVGKSEISIDELLELKENSVINIDKDLAAPLEIRLEGELIALGKLSAVGDNFAIQITEVSSNVAKYNS